MFLKKWKICICVFLKLSTIFVPISAFPPPSSPSLSSSASDSHGCNCVRVKDCQPFTRLLLNHAPHEQQLVFTLVRSAFCGFQQLDALVCCPSYIHPRTTRYAEDEYGTTVSELDDAEPRTTEYGNTEAWIWERRSLSIRFQSDNTFDNPETNLLDYVDVKTQRNCPPVQASYGDADYNDYKQLHEHTREHHMYKYHIAHDVVDLAESPYTPEDHPIVFPDDLRFQTSSFSDFPASDQTPMANTPTTPNLTTVASTQRNNSRPIGNPTDCGISVGQRILGGTANEPGQFPWLTRIAYLNKTNNRINYRCSGSVISNYYILTAAHCIVNLVSDLELSYIRIGGFESTDCTANNANCNLFGIDNVIVHPNYDQPKYANDIALLRFNNYRNARFTSVCLPLNASTTLADRLIGQFGVAAGWSSNVEIESNISGSRRGFTSDDTHARHLRLPIVNTTECAKAYARFSENFRNRIVIQPTHLCAQGQPMNDVCRGDSGGPFMDDGTSGLLNRNGRHTLLGIVAFGPTICGTSSIPGVYTRISSFIDWITSNIK